MRRRRRWDLCQRLVRDCWLVRWCWQRRTWVGLLVRVVCDFVVTLLGVLLALSLANSSERRAADSATANRLGQAVLEAEYVAMDALDVLENSAPGREDRVPLLSFDLFAARAVLEDANAVRVVPVHMLSLLRTYARAAETLQSSLDLLRAYLSSAGFLPTSVASDLRRAVHSNSASLVANAYVVREELRPYFNGSGIDRAALSALEQRIRETRERALAGEVHLSKDLSAPDPSGP